MCLLGDNLKENQEGIKFEVESLKEKLCAQEKENEIQKLHERLAYKFLSPVLSN